MHALPDPIVVCMCYAINLPLNPGTGSVTSWFAKQDIAWDAVDQRLLQVGGMIRKDNGYLIYTPEKENN